MIKSYINRPLKNSSCHFKKLEYLAVSTPYFSPFEKEKE